MNQAVADKLWRLHWDYGYFTRAEIEAALGLDPPPGRRECPGQFGADGKWKSCCGEASWDRRERVLHPVPSRRGVVRVPAATR